MLEINMRAFQSYSTLGSKLNIIFNALSCLSIILYLILLIYCMRLFTIGLPSKLVPWSRSTSNVSYFKTFSYLMVIVIVVFDKNGKYTLFELVACFICFLALTISSYFYIIEFSIV